MTEPTYFVTDIETNGPYPGVHSMLGFASVACRRGDGITGRFERNVAPLPELSEHPEVMDWWRSQPEAFRYVTRNPSPAGAAIAEWVDWVEGHPGERVFVAYPVSFDGMWMDWYLRRFLDRPLFRGPMSGPRLFSDTALDLPSFAMAVLDIGPEDVRRKAYPREWLGNVPHSHKAIDDATGYGHLLLRLLQVQHDRQDSLTEQPQTPRVPPLDSTRRLGDA